MKKTTIVLLSLLAVVFAGCDGVSPETANAFKDEYWMETTSITMNGDSAVNEGRTIWTSVSIYENKGLLYVQTELLGSPDLTSEQPQEIQVTGDNSDQYKSDDKSNEEEVIAPTKPHIVVQNGFIIGINHDIKARSLPIKVQSGSETKLHLEAYKPVEAALTDESGNILVSSNVWYEYGPMVKNGDVITWEVLFRDDFDHGSSVHPLWTHVIHKNTLHKTK